MVSAHRLARRRLPMAWVTLASQDFSTNLMCGWKAVTDAFHTRGGKIVVQLMHTGRVTHVANQPTGAEVVKPTSITCPGEMYTDSQGTQPHSSPREMTVADIAHAVEEYAKSAQLAIQECGRTPGVAWKNVPTQTITAGGVTFACRELGRLPLKETVFF